MSKTEKRAEQLAYNHGGDAKSLAAWALGYIGSLEMEVNGARRELGAPPKSTLAETLDKQLDT
jgi:hypothetical protein